MQSTDSFVRTSSSPSRLDAALAAFAARRGLRHEHRRLLEAVIAGHRGLALCAELALPCVRVQGLLASFGRDYGMTAYDASIEVLRSAAHVPRLRVQGPGVHLRCGLRRAG